MRVCFVIYGSIEQVTGGYVYDRQVIAGLRAAGDEVQIVSLEQHASLPNGTLLRKVLGFRPDIIVGDELCHRELAPLFRGMRALAHWGAKSPRCVLLVHHLSQWETGVPLASESRAVTLADAIVVTSTDSAARLRSGFGIRSVVCVPGVDHLPRRTRLPSTNGALRLLYVGTWTSRKGLLRLVQALRDCGDVEYELTIVGDAQRDEEYRQQVIQCVEQTEPLKRRCTNLGILSDRELAEVYARHDVLVLPSSYEGYGMVLAEAARAGLRILCSDAGGASQAVQQAQVEWIEPGNANALRKALLEAVSTRGQALDLGADMPERAAGFRTWAECVASFRTVLVDALEPSAGVQ